MPPTGRICSARPPCRASSVQKHVWPYTVKHLLLIEGPCSDPAYLSGHSLWCKIRPLYFFAYREWPLTADQSSPEAFTIIHRLMGVTGLIRDLRALLMIDYSMWTLQQCWLLEKDNWVGEFQSCMYSLMVAHSFTRTRSCPVVSCLPPVCVCACVFSWECACMHACTPIFYSFFLNQCIFPHGAWCINNLRIQRLQFLTLHWVVQIFSYFPDSVDKCRLLLPGLTYRYNKGAINPI